MWDVGAECWSRFEAQPRMFRFEVLDVVYIHPRVKQDGFQLAMAEATGVVHKARRSKFLNYRQLLVEDGCVAAWPLDDDLGSLVAACVRKDGEPSLDGRYQ